MSDSVLELTWDEAFEDYPNGHHVSYNNKDTPRDRALERAEAIRDRWQRVRADYEELDGCFYIKLTAGKKAGTIAQIRKGEFKVCPTWLRQSNYKMVETTEVEMTERAYSKDGTFELTGHVCAYRTTMFDAFVDGIEKPVLSFSRKSSVYRTHRPILLIGYRGPTEQKMGEAVRAPEITLVDRYGETVGKGDLVVVGRGSNGKLLVGPITKIMTGSSLKIRVIGSTEEATTSNITPEQILKLDPEIFSRLMIEKLRTA